jgi:Flp pilus assembly protein TadB
MARRRTLDQLVDDAGVRPSSRWKIGPRDSELSRNVRAAARRGQMTRSEREDVDRLQAWEALPRWRRALGRCGRHLRWARVWTWKHPRVAGAIVAFAAGVALWLWLGPPLFGLALLAMVVAFVFVPRPRRRRRRGHKGRSSW